MQEENFYVLCARYLTSKKREIKILTFRLDIFVYLVIHIHSNLIYNDCDRGLKVYSPKYLKLEACFDDPRWAIERVRSTTKPEFRDTKQLHQGITCVSRMYLCANIIRSQTTYLVKTQQSRKYSADTFLSTAPSANTARGVKYSAHEER